VRDHVVELSRDAPALFGYCELRLLLAFALELALFRSFAAPRIGGVPGPAYRS